MSERIGALRARVQLQAPQRTPDDIGGAAITWTDAGSVWAEIAPGGSSASADFDGPTSQASYRVTIRAPNDARAGWRVLWDERILNVEAVVARNAASLELACVEETL